MKSTVTSRSEKTRQLIIETAAPIFNKKGYAGTSLSDLTQATGLTKGSIYGNFKNKDEVAAIFHEKLADTPYTEDVEELTAIARQALRKRFAGTTVGLSGVNFAIAETGTLLLVENEGNGRMCTTAPDVHIAVMGLEKVVEKLSDVPPLLRLLTGSATGQIVTTYVNMITSPRKKGDKDGPKEVHLVILDNGRASILADPQLRRQFHGPIHQIPRTGHDKFDVVHYVEDLLGDRQRPTLVARALPQE